MSSCPACRRLSRSAPRSMWRFQRDARIVRERSSRISAGSQVMAVISVMPKRNVPVACVLTLQPHQQSVAVAQHFLGQRADFMAARGQFGAIAGSIEQARYQVRLQFLDALGNG